MDCSLRSWDYTNKSRNYQDKSAEAVEKRGYEAGCGEKQMGKNKGAEKACDERWG